MKPRRMASVTDVTAWKEANEGEQKSAASVASEADDLATLRAILVGPEQRHLQALQEQVDGITVEAEDVGRVLPEAILLRLRQDHQLPQTLTPLVETAFRQSLKNTPHLWVDLLFPVIGPTIRRAIAQTLRSMLASLNQALEHSLSLRGLSWRLEAWRTGKPFSEIVVLRTLRYRVEQVFLVHNETGLLLRHVVAPTVVVPEGEMIAGMLTAIQDFVHDSFTGPGQHALETVEMGDFTLWIERGSGVTLAAVIRGNAPEELRTVFQDALYYIYLENKESIAAFQGDASSFAGTQEHLESCLRMQLESNSAQSSFLAWKIVGIVCLVGFGLWFTLLLRENWRWESYLQRLRATPGIVVTLAEKRAGTFFVAGLRDPLAEEPEHLLVGTQLNPEKVRSKWEPYHALYPKFILARAKTILMPPLTIALSLSGETLSAAGSASHQWIVDSQKLARAIPGVGAFNIKNVVDEDELLRKQLNASKAAVEQAAVYFLLDTTEFRTDQEETLARLTRELARMFELARQAGQGLLVEISGHTDSSGIRRKNSQLGQARAETVLAALVSRGIARDGMVAVGSEELLHEELTERDQELNRCATFRVVPSAAAQLSR